MQNCTIKRRFMHGTLVFESDKDKVLYENFVKSLKENQVIEEYYEVLDTNATMPQIAKIHAMIRELANHTGYGFTEMKALVKERTGLVLRVKNEDDDDIELKSFAYCSRQELSQCIETCIQLGDLFNYNLR